MRHPKSPISTLPMVGVGIEKKLKKLEISTIQDLLYHTPIRYQEATDTNQLQSLEVGSKTAIEAELLSIKNIFTKTGKVIQEAVFGTEESSVYVIWFNQTYLAKSLKIGSIYRLLGKVGFWKGKLSFVAPEYEQVNLNTDLIHTKGNVAIYPQTEGLKSKMIRKLIDLSLKNTDLSALEYLDEDTLQNNSILKIDQALYKIHKPTDGSDVVNAKKRLAFDELLEAQLSAKQKKASWDKKPSIQKILSNKEDLDNFSKNLPYTLTRSQIKAMEDLASDFVGKKASNRLLEGDVGSGKTIVAAFGCYITALNGAKSAILAPTQVLASQHYSTLKSVLGKYNLDVELVVAGSKNVNKDADVFVGTHALLVKDKIPECAFVVIDEQHKFGVNQRAAIGTNEENEKNPHTLTMTATPIPRTVALTLFGDLDLSILDEVPNGKRDLKTWLVTAEKRQSSYEWIETTLKKTGGRAYVVCPFIQESEAENMTEVKSAEVEYKKLVEVFGSSMVGILHGKMKSKEKESVLSKFKEGEFSILVATPVVEVGIDIPEANIIVIENPERFGLAALHQLRGRVGRKGQQAYCLLMVESASQKAQDRLKNLTRDLNGLQLAEIDLSLRGPGEMFGSRQSGIPEFVHANWSDVELIRQTSKLADTIIENPRRWQMVIEHFSKKQKAPN